MVCCSERAESGKPKVKSPYRRKKPYSLVYDLHFSLKLKPYTLDYTTHHRHPRTHYFFSVELMAWARKGIGMREQIITVTLSWVVAGP